MSDDEKDDKTGSERPNQKYNLSRDDSSVPEGGLTFYYSRERRLANAPESVRNLYKEEKRSRFALFGALVADRPRRFLFLMIVLLCAVILVLSISGFLDTAYTLSENKLEINGARFEGTTIIVLKKNAKNSSAYNGAVDIAVSVPMPLQEDGSLPSEGDYPVFYHRVFFSAEKEEVYRFAVPFDHPELLMVLQSEKNTLQLKLIPK